MISFLVEGRPRSTQTGSVIRVRGRAFPLRRNTPWSALCGLVAREYAPPKPLTGPLRVTLTFYLTSPKKRREHPTGRPDLENLCKGLLDSWQGVLFLDDAQVLELRLAKCYCGDAPPGVHVVVEEMT